MMPDIRRCCVALHLMMMFKVTECHSRLTHSKVLLTKRNTQATQRSLCMCNTSTAAHVAWEYWHEISAYNKDIVHHRVL